MSTLRVDNIKSRTGSVVTIPEGQTLTVTGIGSVMGDVTVAGKLIVNGGAVEVTTGTLDVTGGGNFNNPTGVGTFGTFRVGSGTSTFTETFVVGSTARATGAFRVGTGITITDISNQDVVTDQIRLNKAGDVTNQVRMSRDTESGGLKLTDQGGSDRVNILKPTPLILNTDTQLQVNKTYYVDTTGIGTVTLTLPQTPDPYDFITIVDYQGYFNTSPCIVARHASSTGPATVISGAGQDLEMNVERVTATLSYTGIQTTGWLVK